MNAEDKAELFGKLIAMEYALAAVMAHHPNRGAVLASFRSQLKAFAVQYPETAFESSGPTVDPQWNALFLGRLEAMATNLETIVKSLVPTK